MPTLELLASTAIAVPLKKVIDEVHKNSKGAVRDKIRLWKNRNTLTKLAKNVSSVRDVKTIWQIDNKVDLAEFYFPSKVKVEGETRVVQTTADFQYTGNILLEGIVGQGKSIFLRYLCSQEMHRANRIPIFFELRRIVDGVDLVSNLVDRMQILGFEAGRREFNYLAARGRIVLFLDAFDEIAEANQARLVSEIETLTERFSNLQVIITSRPNTPIVHSPQFRVFQLAPIQTDDIAKVIQKLSESEKLSKRLIKALEDDEGNIRGVLTTPLMITLLVITYRAYERLPMRLAEFYEELFSILIARHDKSKPGFVREKKSGLNDNRLKEVFDTICFLTRRDEKTQCSDEQMSHYCRLALDGCNQKCDEQDVIDDLRQITNLIMHEGRTYFFIHKSVQEFHCASHIANFKNDSLSKRFYRDVRKKWVNWREEIGFLRSVDEYRFAKHFLIPDIEDFFTKFVNRIPKSWNRTPKTVANRIFSRYVCTITTPLKDPRSIMMWWVEQNRRHNEGFIWCLDNIGNFGSSLTQTISTSGFKAYVDGGSAVNLGSDRMGIEGGPYVYDINLKEGVNQKVFDSKKCVMAVHEFMHAILEEYRVAKEIVAAHEKRNEFLDF